MDGSCTKVLRTERKGAALKCREQDEKGERNNKNTNYERAVNNSYGAQGTEIIDS